MYGFDNQSGFAFEKVATTSCFALHPQQKKQSIGEKLRSYVL
jgi:hypothetical protein